MNHASLPHEPSQIAADQKHQPQTQTSKKRRTRQHRGTPHIKIYNSHFTGRTVAFKESTSTKSLRSRPPGVPKVPRNA
ncbi:Hypothetical predicted protein [Pelobates cultripes]|uniref:Uncharacterized protein n=1 Tax=Pelobates cultripes TaxID=61616 RepID=A0AAD1SP98_PELCU|nr:Hypothetical predicted protein [Pelobates cultripes]